MRGDRKGAETPAAEPAALRDTGEPAFSPDGPTVPRPRLNEADLAGAAPVPVAEALQLVSSLRDLPRWRFGALCS